MVMIIRLNILSLVFVAALPGAVYSAGDPAPPETLAISAYEQGREQARSENWDRAAALFQSVVEKDGQDYRALNMLGYSLRQIGRLADSLAAYDRALSIKPDYAPALEQLSLTAGFYHGYLIALQVLQVLVCLVIAALIFKNKSDDWLA
ncbi:MAG: tetratricopeptide repeat protein, partial [Nitrospinota bacterium]|nr:tetratricopeptide repeat protein [Nitrospinota bacterium]